VQGNDALSRQKLHVKAGSGNSHGNVMGTRDHRWQ
jgi:hypothetical protein